MNISTGKIKSAKKVVVYGPEGIGKSTFASHFPNPLFIDTEGGTNELNVARFDRPTSFEMLKQQVEYFKNNGQKLGYKTLVIDTADWAEKLCAKSLLSRCNKQSIEDFGYGKGYTMLAEEFGKLLNLLEDIYQMGFDIVFTAHAFMRKFEQPDEQGSYDRWELKLEKKVAPLLKEWSDLLLFANFKTTVIKQQDGKYKAYGGTERVMYTTHNACYDAKNRYGLPGVLPFDYSQIKAIIEDISQETNVTPEAPAITVSAKSDKINQIVDDTPAAQDIPPTQDIPRYIPKELMDLMQANDVTVAEIERVVTDRGYYPAGTPISNYDPQFISGCLVGAWDKVFSMIMTNRDLPF